MNSRPEHSVPRRVFVSHSQADEAWAEWVSEVLSRGGFEVTRSGEYVDTAERSEGGNPCDELFAIRSGASILSPHVEAEIQAALASMVPVAYLVVDDDGLAGLDLARKRVLDLRFGSLRSLESSLRTMSDRPAQRPTLAGSEESALPLVGDLPGASESLTDRFPPPSVTTSIDRPQLIRELEQRLLVDGPGPGRGVALIGPPGSGKTHLAASFVKDHRWRFRDIAWVRPGVDGSLPLDFAKEPGLDRNTLVIVDEIDDTRVWQTLEEAPASVNVLGIGRGIDLAGERRFAVVAMPAGLHPSEAWDLARHLSPSLSVDDFERILIASAGSPLLLPALVEAASSWGESNALDALQAFRRIEGEADGRYFLDTDDPRLIANWERAFQRLGKDGSEIDFVDFERGSWRRRWRRRFTDERLDALLDSAERAAEVSALSRPEADANRNNAEAIARLMEASAAIPNLVVMSGSVLLVKITDESGSRIVSKTLTPTQLRAFEESEALLSRPADALRFLATNESGSEPALEGE